MPPRRRPELTRASTHGPDTENGATRVRQGGTGVCGTSKHVASPDSSWDQVPLGAPTEPNWSPGPPTRRWTGQEQAPRPTCGSGLLCGRAGRFLF